MLPLENGDVDSEDIDQKNQEIVNMDGARTDKTHRKSGVQQVGADSKSRTSILGSGNEVESKSRTTALSALPSSSQKSPTIPVGHQHEQWAAAITRGATLSDGVPTSPP
mmetsp:Transcript_7896/g.15495  ORF Transcript_7896/g.15495 Transcript_7896/m.15495 type:complete len:109 (-) Transcript_7896:1352-1678(-)